MDKWYVYMVECGDGTIYTGITKDLARRVKQHTTGKGAKYTRGRGPIRLAYQETVQSYSEALRREYAVKQLTHRQKQELILQNRK